MRDVHACMPFHTSLQAAEPITRSTQHTARAGAVGSGTLPARAGVGARGSSAVARAATQVGDDTGTAA